jgi:hypothetical protein
LNKYRRSCGPQGI